MGLLTLNVDAKEAKVWGYMRSEVANIYTEHLL